MRKDQLVKALLTAAKSTKRRTDKPAEAPMRRSTPVKASRPVKATAKHRVAAAGPRTAVAAHKPTNPRVLKHLNQIKATNEFGDESSDDTLRLFENMSDEARQGQQAIR